MAAQSALTVIRAIVASRFNNIHTMELNKIYMFFFQISMFLRACNKVEFGLSRLGERHTNRLHNGGDLINEGMFDMNLQCFPYQQAV